MMGDCLLSDTGKSKLSGTVPHEHLIALCDPSLMMLTKVLDRVSPAGSMLFFVRLRRTDGRGGRILSSFSGIIAETSVMR